MLFRLVAFLQKNPIGVIVLVGFPLRVYHLLDDLLRALGVETGQKQGKQAHHNQVGPSLDHDTTLYLGTLRTFDAGGRGNGSQTYLRTQAAIKEPRFPKLARMPCVYLIVVLPLSITNADK